MGEEHNSDSSDDHVSPNEVKSTNMQCPSKEKMAVQRKSIQDGEGKLDVPETIRITAIELATDIVYYVSGVRKGKAPSKHASTLRRTVQEMHIKHEILYKGMMNKLQITENSAYPVFTNVSNEIFRDNQINWGRLVSVFAFGAKIAKYLCENNNQQCHTRMLNKLAKFLGNYVAEKLGGWISEQGGWVGFAILLLYP